MMHGKAAFALLSLGIAWGQAPQQPNTIEKVTDGLYVIAGDGGNTSVYVTSEGVILVDDKYERDSADVLAKVKSVTDLPVKYVINTHPHPDHTGGNAKLLGSAQIIGHRNAPAAMAQRKIAGPPQITFTDGMSIFLGGKEVVARHFGRGHTNADVFVYFPAERVVATGDMFNTGTFGVAIDYPGGGTILDWTKTLAGALEWDFDTVIPGHGPLARRADLIKSQAAVEAMRNRVRGMVAEGKTKDDVTKVLINEFGWNPAGLGIRNSVDGLMAELKK